MPTTGLADRPFLSRQERPPPKRPPTCWCPLEARASPAPPVRPNQGPDRGEPACEITPLSCSHWARDTLHPCRSSVQPPPPRPTLPLFYTECQWLLFGGKKKRKRKTGEREGYRETRKQLHDGRVLLGLGVQSEQQFQQKSQLKPRLSFIPSFTLVSLYRLQAQEKVTLAVVKALSGPSDKSHFYVMT